MRKSSILTTIGSLIYILAFLVDRFLSPLSNNTFLVVIIVSALFILARLGSFVINKLQTN